MKSSLRYCLYVVGVCIILAVFLSGMHYPVLRISLHWETLPGATIPADVPVNTSLHVTTEHLEKFPVTQTVTSSGFSSSKLPAQTTEEPSPPRKTEDGKFYIYNDPLPPDVTVATAYFNIGSFQKGNTGVFNPVMYMTWATVYQYIRNPLVMYTDSEQIAVNFRSLRARYQNTTKIILVQRTSLWAFDCLDRVRQIYSSPGYPKHHPNTVVPEYTCTQHAKYNVLEETVKENYFNTTYFTWIDLGYFRDVVHRKREFVIVKPPHFNDSQVAMNRVFSMDMNMKVETIFKENVVWLGGGMIFGSRDTLPTFIADYRLAVERYLNMSLSNTDQQVLFSMNTAGERIRVRQRVSIQQYVPRAPADIWFYLGYSCYREII